MLALVVSLAPLAAQARDGEPRLIHQANATQMTPACWSTTFGFLPINCKLGVYITRRGMICPNVCPR
jgi:hypothetical protein